MSLFGKMIVKMLPLVPKPIVARISRPYRAGETLDDAIRCVKDLNHKGFRATIDLLGEFITDFGPVDETIQTYSNVLQAIDEHQLKANISVKPTFFGLLLDAQRTEKNLLGLLETAVKHNNFMRLDMEDSPCTDATLDIYRRFRKQHGQHVGVVLQAYLRRTVDDVKALCEEDRSHFRLCKGIYVEPADIAFKGYQDVRDNFIKCLNTMFDGGAYVGIATHDEYLVDQAEKLIKHRGLTEENYEFQMLLGVRESLRDRIRQAGHQMRIYVPFGQQWYGYSVRRLKENPALASTFFKAMFIKG